MRRRRVGRCNGAWSRWAAHAWAPRAAEAESKADLGLLRQVLKGKKGFHWRLWAVAKVAIALAVLWHHSVTGVQGISWEVCIKKMEVQEPAKIE